MMNYQELRNKLFEDMVKHASEYQSDELAKLLPLNREIENRHVFSEDFTNRMKKLIKQQKKLKNRRRYARLRKRVAVIILALFAGISILAANVDALRTPIINFFIEVKEKFTRVNIQKGSTDESANNENKGAAMIPDNIKEYLPAYIPDGYEIIDFTETSKGYTAIYSNGEEEKIVFSKSTQARNISFNTEDAGVIETEINNNKAYISVKDNKTILIMINDKGEVYTLVGNIDQTEAVKIMQSAENGK